MNKEEKLTGCLVTLLALPFLAVLRAVVIHDFWSWFVVPLGVSAVSYAHALGISFAVSVVTYQSDATDKEHGSDPIEGLFKVVVLNLFAWAFGWLVHMAMVSGW